MQFPQEKEIASTIRDAKEFLDSRTGDALSESDVQQLHHYLTDLASHIGDPEAPADLVPTTARLYFAAERYQQAADLLQGSNSSGLLTSCQFHNGCFVPRRDWLSRQDRIWAALEDAAPSNTMNRTLREAWDPHFPTEHLHPIPYEAGDSKAGIILLGNPNGIYSLFPMSYLVQHVPDRIAQRWDVALDSPGVYAESIQAGDMEMHTRDVAVQITPSAGFHAAPRVDLTFWHPALQALQQQGEAETAIQLVMHLLSTALRAVVSTLYVDRIALAEAPLGGGKNTVPLNALAQWFLDHDMSLGDAPHKVLRHRLYAYDREPALEAWPRGDITEGVTCMPELEEIYFLQDGKGLAAFQRYGVGCWFLTVPKSVCGKEHWNFRDALIAAVREKEGDTVCFTGWAEGTRNCYIDFLALSSASVLHTLWQYLQTVPGGEDVRISAFYWDSPPRTLESVLEVQTAEPPDPAELSKERIAAEDRANLEKAFRETQWEQLDEDPDWDIDAASPYADAIDRLDSVIQYVQVCKTQNNPLNYAAIHTMLETYLPEDDDPDMDPVLCDRIATVLMTLEQFRECTKWAHRIADADYEAVLCYSSDLGSSFPDGQYQWENRRQAFWRQFSEAEAGLGQALLHRHENADPLLSFLIQADAAFPCQEAILIGPEGDKKHALLTGLPGGILTLPAMLYFTSHYPGSIGRRWDIAVSWEGEPLALLPKGRQDIETMDVRVSLSEQDGKVSLSLWNLLLYYFSVEHPKVGKGLAAQLVNITLPMGARLLYVSDISAAAEEPEDSFPLPELRQQLEARGFHTDISLDRLLSRRRYTITRTPKNTGRPRDDILRGETCMPELERIYNRLYEEGQTILERHGINALFLMIPNDLCGGDPAQYRQKLQRYLTLAEGDKVFFTGWAEGTEYCYLDLISMQGHTLLEKLNEYAISNPGSKDLRYSTFYWNSPPRSWLLWDVQGDLLPEGMSNATAFAKARKIPNFQVPDPDTAAAFEASFRPDFTPEDFRTPKAAPAAAQAPAAKNPLGSSKKLSKAQRNALNSKNSQNGKNNKGGKNKKKR